MVEDFVYSENPLNPEIYKGYIVTGKVVENDNNNKLLILQMRIDGRHSYVYLRTQFGDLQEHSKARYEYLKKLEICKEKGKRLFNSLSGIKKEQFIRRMNTNLENDRDLSDEEESVSVYLDQINLRRLFAELLLDNELNADIRVNTDLTA